MPEGPEIRRAADRLACVLDGMRIDAAVLNHDALHAHRVAIVGARVSRVYCRGKAMLIEFDSGITIYSHNQLYGVWQACALDAPPLDSRQLRLELCAGENAVRLYSATDISVWETQCVAEHPYLQKLGPDVLDESLTPADFFTQLDNAPFRRRSLAALYLDQGFAAGIGNYLRSEILFAAGCHPDLRPVDLNVQQRRKLAQQTLKICQLSYKTGGVTNRASRVKKMKRQGVLFEGYRFCIFERDGAACYNCGDTVVREARGSRRIYWCPTCQLID